MAKKKHKHSQRRRPMKQSNTTNIIDFSKGTKDTQPKPKLTKKDILIRIAETAIVLSLLFAAILGYGYYRNTHHGYMTSQKTIENYIQALDKQYASLIQLCFDSHSDTYEETVKQAIEDRNSISTSFTIDYDNITIEEDTLNIVDSLIQTTGNINITAAKTSLVKIPLVENINGQDKTTNYYYEFITYCDISGRWYIHNFQLLIHNIKQENVNLTDIGSKETGYILIPDTWKQITTTQKSDYILKDITFMSPNNETISLLAMSNEIKPKHMVELACESLTEQNMQYSIEENASLGGYKCTVITGVSKDSLTTSVVWIFSTPLIDTYTHYIEISCITENSKEYIDYVSSFASR